MRHRGHRCQPMLLATGSPSRVSLTETCGHAFAGTGMVSLGNTCSYVASEEASISLCFFEGDNSEEESSLA
jgi:hypothetical protein